MPSALKRWVIASGWTPSQSDIDWTRNMMRMMRVGGYMVLSRRVWHFCKEVQDGVGAAGTSQPVA